MIVVGKDKFFCTTPCACELHLCFLQKASEDSLFVANEYGYLEIAFGFILSFPSVYSRQVFFRMHKVNLGQYIYIFFINFHGTQTMR